jgi:hypothetical protein
MDDNLHLRVLYQFGQKYFELQQGFAAMFNLCLDKKLFTESRYEGLIR